MPIIIVELDLIRSKGACFDICLDCGEADFLPELTSKRAFIGLYHQLRGVPRLLILVCVRFMINLVVSNGFDTILRVVEYHVNTCGMIWRGGC